MKTLALVALVGSLAACSQASPGVRFAIAETSAARWSGSMRLSVVDRNVNMMEPLGVEANEGGTATISYARRGREGARVTIDASTLAPRGATPFVFEEHEKRFVPPCRKTEPTIVRATTGAQARVWTDEASGRIFADGSGTAAPVDLLPADRHAVGQPKVVLVDDHRVVLVFFADAEDGFELVAGAFEI
jgi:hypothetical protein